MRRTDGSNGSAAPPDESSTLTSPSPLEPDPAESCEAPMSTPPPAIDPVLHVPELISNCVQAPSPAAILAPTPVAATTIVKAISRILDRSMVHIP
jgi:hypothetical protein